MRVQPVGRPGDYQTYRIHQIDDRLIPQACKEAGCLAWRKGWKSVFDETTDFGRQQATYVRHSSGRTFTEQRTAEGLTVFTFEPGQRCFRQHFTRPTLFLVQGGDWRQRRGLLRQHVNADDWVEDFATHQARIAEQIERG